MNADPHDHFAEPQPLRRDDAPENAELAQLFARIKPRQPLDDLTVQRIRRGLEQRLGAKTSRRRRWTTMVLAIAASLFLIETFAALAISAWPAWRHSAMRSLPPPAPAIRQSAVSDVAAPVLPDLQPTSPSAPVEPAAFPTSPAPPLPIRSHRTQEGKRNVRLPSGPAVAGRTIDDAEVTAYLGALAELNVRNDPARALRMLETYRAQYPAGLFRDEVAVAEIRADMALGREGEALGLLDGLPNGTSAALPQAGELAVLRVELLDRHHRCAEALPLVVSDLESPLSGGQRERLLFERGACDAALGNLESGQQDLRDYLRQFPHGRFEAELRQRLARATPASE